MQLGGKVALVTGGATGLGAATCRALAARGVSVAANYSRSAAAAEAVAAEIEATGGRALAVQADVADAAAVARMVAEVEERLGPLSLLVNNAGTTRYVPFADLDGVTDEVWEAILRVNVLGSWHCAAAVAPGMRARGEGAIVNVSSDSAFTLDGSSIPYVVSKAGLVAMTRALASALGPAVRVTCVAPGWMETPWLERHLPEEVRAGLTAGPGDVVPVEDVAEEIVRLLAAGDGGEVTLMTGERPAQRVY